MHGCGGLDVPKRKPVIDVREKRKWNFSTLHELHARANALLRQAILNERYKRWRKVIDSYLELLWVINLDNLPDDYEPPSTYSLLLYELYFHLGVAYQHLGNHKKAVKHFTKTIEVVSIAKNGCLAGCLTNSCLMTPIYTRRAFAYARLGSYKLSLKDAEKAVVLDSKSPDVYCIRALVRSSFDDEIMGLQDINTSLKFDQNHVCAMVLKASLTKPLAVRLCQDAETYLTCNSFLHPCIMEFYDKFLFPLSVPHTITTINLNPEKPKASLMFKDGTGNEGQHVFRCGAAEGADINRVSLKRRTDYGNAIRKFVSRPKSAAEFFRQLETQRRRQAITRRAESAIMKPGQRFATSRARFQVIQEDSTGSGQSATGDRVTRPATAPAACQTVSGSFRGRSTGPSILNNSNGSVQVSAQRPATTAGEQADNDKQPMTSSNKKIVIETPSDYSIPIFQPVNIEFAPRMYYSIDGTRHMAVTWQEQGVRCHVSRVSHNRCKMCSRSISRLIDSHSKDHIRLMLPWGGDKLPVAERQPFNFTPAFY